MNEALEGFLLFLVAPIAFVLLIWWFFRKYPPPKQKNDITNTFDAIKQYQNHYPGVVGRIVKYGLVLGFLAVLLLRIYVLLTN